MKEFPKLKKNQVVILRAEKSTGHVLDEQLEIVINDKQNVYTVFETEEEALNFSQTLLKQSQGIEIVIYGSEEQVLHFINK